MPDNEPTLAEILRAAVDARLADIHTACPGRVERYYPSTNETPCVDVTPVMRRALPADDGTIVTEDLPTIPCVPVAFPQATGFSLTWPLAPGDHVVLLFTHSSIDAWRDTGQISDPSDVRRHSLGSCIAIPGIGHQKQSLPCDPLAMVLTGLVMVDKTATAYVALDTLVRARIKEFVAAFCNAVPVPQDGGAAIQNAVKAALVTWGASWDPPSVACTKLKAL